MSYISLKDILISARQESHRMHHYYLGVEHIFIALLEVNDGIASNILESYGFKPSYVIDAIRRKIGKGGKHRLWAGTPNTPRADIIMDIAHEIALDDGRNGIHERDLLIAILEESDNIPTRILRTLGIDTNTLMTQVATYTKQAKSTSHFVTFELNPDNKFSVNKDESYILRRMFNGYEKIYIDKKISNNFTNSKLFFTTPIQASGSSSQHVAVKIDLTDIILEEVHRYEHYIKQQLPLEIPTINDVPIAPESSAYAGIKYDLASDTLNSLSTLCDKVSVWQPTQIEDWIQRNIYNVYSDIFGNDTTACQFVAQQEYARLLPPLLKIRAVDTSSVSDDVPVISQQPRQNISRFETGDLIGIKNCFIKKVDKAKQCLHLTFDDEIENPNTHDIILLNVDFRNNTHYKGESIDLLYGTVWKTRAQLLAESVEQLDPIFDTSHVTLNYRERGIVNPIVAYSDLLEMTVDGTSSTIHGNLHLDNILIDAEDKAQLVDYSQTHRGHRLYDWVMLELSLLTDYILPLQESNDWDSIWETANNIKMLNTIVSNSEIDHSLSPSFLTIQAIRKIVQKTLRNKEDWSEYYIVLALASLHAMTLETMHMEGRRLMYLNSGLAIQALRHYQSNLTNNLADTSDTTDPS